MNLADYSSREAAVEGQQRLRSDVDRQHGLLSVRSQPHDEPLLVPDRYEAAQAAHASRRLRRHDASAGPDAIVYEQAGYIHLLDAKTGQSKQLTIDVNGDLPVGTPAVQARGGDDSRSRAVADRRARRVRRARRDLHRADRQGRFAKSHAEHGRARSRARVVARRQPARLVLRRERRVSAHDRRSVRTSTKPRAIPLPAAAFYSDARRGRPTASICRSRTIISTSGRSTSPPERRRRSTPTPTPIPAARSSRLVVRLAVDRVLEEPRQPPPRDLRLLDGRRKGDRR